MIAATAPGQVLLYLLLDGDGHFVTDRPVISYDGRELLVKTRSVES